MAGKGNTCFSRRRAAVDHEHLPGRRTTPRPRPGTGPRSRFLVGLADAADRLRRLDAGRGTPSSFQKYSLKSVWIRPGAMALTRTPCGPNSRAQLRVIMISPALVKLYSSPPGCGCRPGDRSDVDDRAAASRSIIPGTVSRTSRRAALDVDLDHLVEHLVGHVQRRPLADVRGAVVDQDVDRPEPRLGLADQVLELIQPADVAGDRHDLARQRGELGGGGLQVLQLAAGDDDVRPRPRPVAWRSPCRCRDRRR